MSDANMNNYYGGFGAGTNYYGIPYGGMPQPFQPPVPKMTQILTQEEIKELRNKNGSFSINVDPIELKKSLCVHRAGGAFATMQNADGVSVDCTICGENFIPIYTADIGEIRSAVKKVTDILNTIKMAYVDLPPEMGREFMPIIALLSKIEGLYTIAINDLNKYTNFQTDANSGSGYGNAFTNLNMVVGGGYPQYGQPMQPTMYGYQYGGQMPGMYGYPQYGQQPVQPMYDPNQQAMGYSAGVAAQNMAAPNGMPAPAPQGYYGSPVPPTQNPFYANSAPMQPQQTGYPTPPAVGIPQAPQPGQAPYAAPKAPQPVPAAPTSTPTPAPSSEVTVIETLSV